ncbi:SDR family NAD(P)-dependent oxidoreductase [Streptomyces sp. NPDC056883]|uniref:SDR family NAD(P)-dependent oxidoreductase n=1 Tax=Streptomyces sp. NPDC056883 TaxID=3345959 RepID=UPI0036B48497
MSTAVGLASRRARAPAPTRRLPIRTGWSGQSAAPSWRRIIAAKAFDDRGARLALLGLEAERLREVAASLHNEAGCWEVDVTDAADMADTARQVRARFGPVSLVVANAGVAEGGPFADSDLQVWRRVIEVNLIGSAVTARCFLRDLLDTHGYYLQVASLAAMGTSPLMSAYCASKAGAESFAHALRAELAHRDVAVRVAYINWTDTDMIRGTDARKVHSTSHVADRLATAAERSKASVYVPGWLRAVQPVRALLPPIVTHIARTERIRARPPR